MRTFLGVVIAVLGIGAIGATLLGFGPMTTFWQAAHIVAGVALIAGGVSLVRSTSTVAIDTINDDDMDYTNMGR